MWVLLRSRFLCRTSDTMLLDPKTETRSFWRIIGIHQCAKNLHRGSVRNGMMLFFVCFDQSHQDFGILLFFTRRILFARQLVQDGQVLLMLVLGCNRRWRANVQRILCRHCNQILATPSHRNRQGSECNVDGDTPGCLSQDSGSASSRAVRSSCFEGANGFVTVTPFQVKPSCRSSVRRSRQPDSAAADRITESQISSW